MRLTLPALITALIPFLAAPLSAQTAPPDTVTTLDALVVTADRAQTLLAESVAAVSILTRARLSAVPNATLADALRQLPGFALLDLDGLGYDPLITVRGFYGGGEAEYVVVLLDGRPMNDVQSGRVAWDAIPLAAVERVEVVRGGSSALWGDAAIGGVINVVTKQAVARPAVDWMTAGGTYGTWRGSAAAHGAIGGRAASASVGVDRTRGFRDHSERTAGRAAGTLALAAGPTGSLTASLGAHWRDHDVPGPLPGSAVATDRSAADVFYRFDRTVDRAWRLGLDLDRTLNERVELSASVGGDVRDVEAIRTLGLSPDFADTQERVLGTARGTGTAQIDIDGTGLPVTDRLTIGIEAAHATADSEYYRVVSGDRAAYQAATGARGDLDTSGRGDRTAAAAFAQYTLLPVDAVRISAGVRADWLRDGFSPSEPDDDALDAAHRAISPRLGVNVQYLRSAVHTGNVYLTAGRSFKAPTLDQLFDQRRMPVPFPPWSVSISNALLDPQRGASVEVGLFHGVALVPGTLNAELSLAVYQMDMEDELDFDLETFRYINIGRSRHRGVEAGLRLVSPRAGSAFLNYTQQRVTQRAGEHTGSRLKAIPLHSLSAGVDASVVGRLRTGLVVSHARDIFLDDANTLTLPPYTRVDAAVSYPVASVRLFLDVRNVLDARYSTTGFPDPSGSDVVFYHPAAGRTIEVGVRGSH
jgi:outer membrane receptor protein involved in Fe transport